MNKIHSKVWNKELGQIVVASEFATSDSAGVVQGAASARRTLLAVALAPLLALAGTTAVAQDWTVTDGTTPAVIGDSGTVTFQGDNNINVAQTGADGDAVLEITLERDIDVDTITVGDTFIDTNGVAIGAATLNATGLHVGGVSVTGTGINAGGNTIAGVAAGTAADHAVNFGQLDAVQGTVADHAAAILANADEIEAVRATASAGWDISAEGGTAANVGSGGSVDFSGDGNIEVARTGTDLTFSLADDISVDSIEVGGMTLDSGGIDVAGQRITGLADGAISETSTDAVTGRQLHNALFEGGTAFGVRYFRANSFAPDSVAEGQEAVAIGPGTVAGGDSSFAAGDGAATTETAEGAIALGQGAVAGTEGGDVDDGVGSIAIGRDSQASGNSTVALGDGANVASEHVADATALGAGASVTGNFATGGTAVGANAHASAGNATALGTNAHASGGASIAVGQAHAAAGNAIAAGTGAYVGSYNSIALGTGAGVGTEGVDAGDRTDHIAIGTAAGQNVVGNQSTAIGYGAGQGVVGDGNVALGVEAGRGLAGNNNISIGVNANDGAGARAQAIAIGDGTAAGSDSVALGSGASAAGSETVALGKDSRAGANGVALGAHAEAQGSNVAIGRNSIAYESDVTGSGYLTGDAAPGSAVSVGSSNPGEAFQRRITNLADGAQRYDAVNVGQLQEAQRSVATLVGGGVTLNADGTYSPIIVDVAGGGTAEFATVVEAIGAVTSGAIDILPVDAVRYNAVGGISNVAAGTSATDAVNVEQLNEAIAESGVKYFSANTTVDANRGNDGATATDAMAIGPAAVASGASSLAAGHAARVNAGAHNGVAIGYDVSARAENATVLGNRSHTYDAGGVAIGQEAVSRGQNSIVMGTGAEADPKSGQTVDNAIVIGTEAEATADDGIAIGQSALASEDRAVAQGFDAHAMAVDSQASGTRARSTGVNSQASGTDAHASGANAIASGTNARGYATDGIAMGTGAISGFVVDVPGDAARNHGAIAIGDTSRADDLNAMALGVEAQARAESATAIGDSAVATEDAEDGLAVGSSARVTAQNASAFGQSAEAVAEDALAVGSGARAAGQSASAVGHGAEASATSASAFGQGARALHEGSVALGSGAQTAAAVGTASYTVDKNTYNFAGTAPVATVSVGAPGEERTITNVAAGRISAQSTDAINGSQLYSTNQAVDALGDDLDTAGRSVATALGGTSVYDPDTHTVTAGLSVRGNNYTNVQDALDYVGQGWDVSAQGGVAQNVAPGGQVDFSNQDGNINIARSGTNLTFNLDDELEIGTSISVGGTVINGTSVTTTNVTATNLTVSGETQLGDNFVVNNAGDVIYNGSEVATQADGLSFAGNTGGDISKTLGDNTPLTISGGLGASEASTGANLRVDSAGGQLNLVMARDLTDLDSITINSGPVINNLGIDMGDTRITNLAAGEAGTDAVNVSQLEAVEAIANAGWNVSAQGENATNVGVNSETGNSVDLNNADGNIVITKADDSNDITFDLAENIDLGENGSLTTGNTVVNNDGLTVEDDAGNETTVGAAGTTVEDAAGNVTMVAADGTTVDDGAGNTTTVAATGTTVTDGNATTSVEAGVVTVTANPTTGPANTIVIDANTGTIGGLTNTTFDPDATYTGGLAATQEQLSQVNSDLTLAGLDFVGDDGTVVHRDLGEQLSITGGATGALSEGNIGVTANAAGDGLVVELADNIELTEDGSLTIGDAELDNDGLSVMDAAGNVTTVAADGTTVTDAAGNSTAVGAGTVNLSDGTSTTNLGPTFVNVGGANPILIDGEAGTIGGLSNRTFDPNATYTGGVAATQEQLSLAHGDLITEGLNFVGDDGQVVHRDLGDELSITGGADLTALSEGNIGVTRNDDADGLVIELADNIELTEDGSLEIGDGTDGSTLDMDGLTVVDGDNETTVGAGTVSVTDGANTTSIGPTTVVVGGEHSITIDGSTGTIGGLENTTFDPNDFTSGQAATEDQLEWVHGVASAGWNVLDEEGNEANIGPDGNLTFIAGNDNLTVELLDDTDDAGVMEITLADEIELTEDGRLTIGDAELDNDGLTLVDDAGNETIVSADRTTVTDAAGNSTAVGAGTVNLTDGTYETNLGPTFVNVGGANPILIDGNAGTIGGLSNRTFDPSATYTGGVAATQEQLSLAHGDLITEGLNFVGDDGQVVHRDLGDELSITGGADLTALSEGNIGVTRNDDADGLVIELADNIELTEDGSLEIGDGTDGSTLDMDGLTVVDGGNRTAVGAGTVNLTDGTYTTHLGPTYVNVDGANSILIDGNAGTISGLYNTTINYPEFADGSGRAATEEQLAQVNQTANMGWNISAQGENQTNVGPGDSVDLSNTDGNIVIAKGDDSNDVTFDLADDLVIGNSVTVGDTYIDTTGVAIGADVHLGNTGLVINNGPSVTVAGIDAGGLVITNVAPGEISATSTDAINGSQLFGMGDSIVNVIGGNAVMNPDGTITTSDIGGTGHDNIDDAIRAANDAANAGWTATDADGNAANIGPGGSVAFTGDRNVQVAQTGDDDSGQVEITLNRDLDVDSITAGNTVIDTDGVRVGDDVHLGDTGLVIEGGPSVTTDGIDAGGSVITNVGAGVNDTDAVNVGQLNEVAADVVDLGDRMDVVEGDVADLQAGATGPFQVSQEAPLVPPTPTGENSAAGGSGADASGDNSTALGNQAVASGANSTAVGQGAQATHDNSVALGQGSATTVGAQTGYDAAYVGSSDSAGEVNVGNRTISGVAPGVAGTDAVNVNQLNAGVNHAVVTANAYTDQRFNQVQNDVWHLHGRVDELERDINAGVATAMAMRQAPYVAGATTYYAGFGTYKGEGALGVSLRRTADNGRWSLEGGFSANRDGAGGYIGVSGVLGSK